MKNYVLKIATDALNDIQEIIEWYNNQKPQLGNQFYKKAIKQIDRLKKNPNIYAVRYAEIRCMQIKKFPYLVHYNVDETNKIIEVLAVISTSRDPEIWQPKINKTIT